MEIKLMYGLFASFIAVLLLSVGILYLIFSPNPIANAWYNMTDSTADLILAAIYRDPEEEGEEIRDDQTFSAQNNQSVTADGTRQDEQVLKSETAAQMTESTDQQTNIITMEAAPEFNLDQLYRFINAHRDENNLTQLSVNLALERSARTKVIDMIQDDYWRHENTSGEPTWQFLKNAGYQYELAGENLSFGHNTAWQTFEGWLNSADHNAQMLKSEYEDMGAAYDCYTYTKNGQPSCIVVLHLGKQI